MNQQIATPSILRVFRTALAVLSLLAVLGCFTIAGCAFPEEADGNAALATQSPVVTPAPPNYGGEVVPAREGQGPFEIWLDDYECIPNVLTVVKGTTVTWTSFSFQPLAVVSDGGLFTGSVEPKRTWSFVFTITGTFAYTVDPYSGAWRGVVIVTE